MAKRGREAGQGVGYLPDGTMVVVEQTADRIGEALSVEVTSIVSTSRGRMLFASLIEADDPTPRPRLLRGDAG